MEITHLRFLIIDDMPVMRKIYKKSLQKLKVDESLIIEAQDGLEGWKIINDASQTLKPIEFIISDWNMPLVDGIELVQKIRSDEIFQNLPFLMVTAENTPENIRKAMEAGVDNFISKPFKLEDLESRIRKVTNNLKIKKVG